MALGRRLNAEQDQRKAKLEGNLGGRDELSVYSGFLNNGAAIDVNAVKKQKHFGVCVRCSWAWICLAFVLECVCFCACWEGRESVSEGQEEGLPVCSGSQQEVAT